MIEIRVVDFSEFPGPRYESLGPNSGEKFRDLVLAPAIQKHGADIIVDLDGTVGYGSSFLEEAFGGLVRKKQVTPEQAWRIAENLRSEDDPSYIYEIREYIEDAIKEVEGK